MMTRKNIEGGAKKTASKSKGGARDRQTLMEGSGTEKVTAPPQETKRPPKANRSPSLPKSVAADTTPPVVTETLPVPVASPIEREDGLEEAQELASDNIVKNHVIIAMGVGVLPLPLADIAAITLVQIRMIRKLAALFAIPVDESLIRMSLAALTGSLSAVVGATTCVAGLNKLAPGVGWIIGGSTMSSMAGATTYAIGKVYTMHFMSGGVLLDFDPAAMRSHFRRLLNEKRN